MLDWRHEWWKLLVSQQPVQIRLLAHLTGLLGRSWILEDLLADHSWRRNTDVVPLRLRLLMWLQLLFEPENHILDQVIGLEILLRLQAWLSSDWLTRFNRLRSGYVLELFEIPEIMVVFQSWNDWQHLVLSRVLSLRPFFPISRGGMTGDSVLLTHWVAGKYFSGLGF